MEKRITGHTELIGLFATPIRHSKSPTMHNCAFRHLGLDLAYLAFEVGSEELEDCMKGFRAMKLVGANVSMPNKRIIGKYLDELTTSAKLCEAVNTIVNKDGHLIGDITDGKGFVLGLEDASFDIKGKTMTIVGAGGAATAIVIECALQGIKEIRIFNRHDEFYDNGLKNCAKIQEHTDTIVSMHDLDDLDDLKACIASSDIFVNATGVGMKPLEGKTYIPDSSYLPSNVFVCDIIYSPATTALLELASEAGCKYINGLPMMLYQGAEAFKQWTGKDMPIDKVKEELGL